jgi:sugar phosphate isomerase/epimerase
MPAPIALELYSVRDALATDFEGVIRQVADMGYVGVETAGVFGGSPQDARRLFDELGLIVASVHIRMPLGDDRAPVLDTMAALGCNYLVVPHIPEEQFKTRDQIKAVCDRLNQSNAVARENGLTLFYHNHWWEFTPSAALGGKTPFDLMVGQLDATIGFEFDLYWAKTGGTDPIQLLKGYSSRAPLLHIKDGPGQTDAPMTAVGEGAMDYPAIIAAAGSNPQWLIVELDRCATDMLEAVRKSCAYLTQNGLARSNKR